MIISHKPIVRANYVYSSSPYICAIQPPRFACKGDSCTDSITIKPNEYQINAGSAHVTELTNYLVVVGL